jgi:hypothetical protein
VSGEDRPGTLFLTPRQTHELAAAALAVVGSVSPAVLQRCRRNRAHNARPGVSPATLADLADVLDRLIPGVVEQMHRETGGDVR